jgi:hypothetical protein
VVELLVAKGAHKTEKTNDGKTALEIAREKGYQQVVALLE